MFRVRLPYLRPLLLGVLLGWGLTPAWSDVHVIDPMQDTFVLDPGPASPHPNGAHHNYGGAGSRSVAAATAYAVNTAAGIYHEPKGLFRSLLQFDLSRVTGQTVIAVGLNLYITNGNQSAFGLYNNYGHEGVFRIDRIANNWDQGTDTPHDDKTSEMGITHATLESLLAESGPVWTADCEYDANHAYSDPKWYRFELPLEDTDLCQAFLSGQTLSLMLSPADEKVSFNFTAYTQMNTKPSNILYRDTGPYLNVVTAAYRVVDNFDSYDSEAAIDDVNSVFSAWQTNSDSGLLTTGPVVKTCHYDGDQSLQLDFDNDGQIVWEGSMLAVEAYSETTRTLRPTQDWTAKGMQTISLAWAGDAGNVSLAETDRFYVRLEDRSTAKSEPVICDGHLTEAAWHEWVIPLSAFRGVDLTQIKRMSLGVGNPIDPQSGGTGTLWIDAIRVSPEAPMRESDTE